MHKRRATCASRVDSAGRMPVIEHLNLNTQPSCLGADLGLQTMPLDSDANEKDEQLVTTDGPDALSLHEDAPNGSHAQEEESTSEDGQEDDEHQESGSEADDSEGGPDGDHVDGPQDAEESDDEGDEEDEDYEDEDEEPALKYERLGGSVHDLLQKDSASALAYAHQRLVRATRGPGGDANHAYRLWEPTRVSCTY